MRLTFSRRLTQNLTPLIMGKLRERVNATFYLRNLYSCAIVNNEDRRSMISINKKEGLLG